MSYTRLTWVESETPLSAQNMNNIEDGIEELQAQKVDKTSGKGLSTNDYSTEEKTKLAGIEAGAEVNVQSDWGQSDSTADDFIKNKPDNATTSTAGLMSAADKTKLNGIAAGAEVNQNAFSKVTGIWYTGAGTSAQSVEATSATDTFKLVCQANSGIKITKNITSGNLELASTLTAATSSANGLMSSTDKAKLDGIEAGAFVVKKASLTTNSLNVPGNESKSGTIGVSSSKTILGVTGWEISGNSPVFLENLYVDNSGDVRYTLKNPTSFAVTIDTLKIHYIYTD